MKFNQAVNYARVQPTARTENGMRAYRQTGSALVDLFGKVAASRGSDVTPILMAALAEDRDVAMRIMLWTRDARGGAGERQTFRDMLRALEREDPRQAERLMHKVPELGRWDDLFTYQDPANRRAAFTMIAKALVNGDGLCAKWMPRKGPLAVELTQFLRITPRQYRKLLVRLTKVVESQMCARDWDSIEYSHVPSVAATRYQKAFKRHSPERYGAYLAELAKPKEERDPKVKINASVSFPYDILRQVARGDDKRAAVAQWEALPDSVKGGSILPVVDVSGSMGSYDYGRMTGNPQPIEVAVSLGLYLSERAHGDFKDVFVSFSGESELVQLKGDISQKMQQMLQSHWGMNTDLVRAMENILKVAREGNVQPADMPRYLLVISDMQFDECACFDDTAMESIRRQFRAAGYEVPGVVFWNVSAGQRDNVPMKAHESGVALVSGYSPSIMRSILDGHIDDMTPHGIMMRTVMVDRYAV